MFCELHCLCVPEHSKFSQCFVKHLLCIMFIDIVDCTIHCVLSSTAWLYLFEGLGVRYHFRKWLVPFYDVLKMVCGSNRTHPPLSFPSPANYFALCVYLPYLSTLWARPVQKLTKKNSRALLFHVLLLLILSVICCIFLCRWQCLSVSCFSHIYFRAAYILPFSFVIRLL